MQTLFSVIYHLSLRRVATFSQLNEAARNIATHVVGHRDDCGDADGISSDVDRVNTSATSNDDIVHQVVIHAGRIGGSSPLKVPLRFSGLDGVGTLILPPLNGECRAKVKPSCPKDTARWPRMEKLRLRSM
jgi:hypothetical protein